VLTKAPARAHDAVHDGFQAIMYAASAAETQAVYRRFDGARGAHTGAEGVDEPLIVI